MFILHPVCDAMHFPVRLFTVLYFSRKIVEIESFALRAAHLAWVSKLLRGRGRFEGKREKFFCPLPLPRAIIPDTRSLGTLENQDSRDGKTRYI